MTGRLRLHGARQLRNLGEDRFECLAANYGLGDGGVARRSLLILQLQGSANWPVLVKDLCC
jgi:hypothetical protein